MTPASDAEVSGWAAALGIPGLYDVHVHFMPPPVMHRVWEHFEAEGPLIGRPWPITYKGTDEERVERLRALGVRRFSALPYAHRPGIADFLNDWARSFAAQWPDCLHSATFFPEPAASGYVADLLSDGAEVFKVHVQVGDFDLRDPLLDEVWGQLADAGVPVVIHAGSGPVPNAHTGPEPVRAVLRRHPSLTAVIAHMGAPEYAEFLEMAEEFDRVFLDTTMAFTDFFEEMAAYPVGLKPRLADLSDRILLGSDFPNIPYPYAHQIEALQRLEMGDEWLRKVCWENGNSLVG